MTQKRPIIGYYS